MSGDKVIAAGQLDPTACPVPSETGTIATPGVIADPWPQLRALTPARLALGRAGCSLPTAEVLRFGLAHAQARDAVHHGLDADALAQRLRDAGYRTETVRSAASDRWQYLARPDLGRRLDEASREALSGWRVEPPDLLVVIGDGLSAAAVDRHAVPVLEAACAQMGDALAGRLPPVIVAREARVALGDEIGQCLGAQMVVVMIGERPGLSSPDSMGIYVTYAPRVGRTDAERNCISNIRPAGLPYAAAATELATLIGRIRACGCSGVHLPGHAAMAKVMGDI